MPEILIGLVLGLWIGAKQGYDARTSLIIGAGIALLLYIASCYFFPYRRCWRCGGEDRVFDGRENYRRRWSACWWCRGEKDNRRVGSRLMGLG